MNIDYVEEDDNEEMEDYFNYNNNSDYYENSKSCCNGVGQDDCYDNFDNSTVCLSYAEVLD